MKGSHSRLSFQTANRYSNLAHIQGGMLTDADLTEAGQIHQARDDAQGTAFAGSGVPATGGMLAQDEEFVLVFRDGTVFAQGKQGHFRLTRKEGEEDKRENLGFDLIDAFARQADLPDSPNPTEGLVYVDLWEREIFPHEAPYLADAALHGAQTSYRTRTMVQLKTLPEVDDLAKLPKALQAHPAFLPKGTATLRAALTRGETVAETCDPCADLISIEKVLPNALMRLEVVSVERDEGGKMVAVRLAWSSENAEMVEPLASRAALERDGAIYEYFSETSEMQAGYVHPKYVPARGAFVTDLTSDGPNDPTLPDEASRAFTHVRRWDGMVRVPLNTRSRITGPSAGASRASVNTSEITLTTEFATFSLTHGEREMVAGDYWLLELRRFADAGAQALLNGEPLEEKLGKPPLGPVHHFCPIGLFDGEMFEELPDALARRLSFPTLADIPASHIRYDANPDCDLLGRTETVQQALDKVCDIDARHVGFTPSDEECDTLGGVRSVDAALNALCRADNNKQLQLMLRTMMDWGVVCGLSAELGPEGIEISGGVALDRNGVLHERPRDQIRLSDLDEEQLLPDPKSFAELQGKNVEICLSLGIKNGRAAYFLSPAYMAYRASDLTLSDQVENCLEGRGSLTESDLFQDIPRDSGRVEVLSLLHVCLRNNISPLPGMELDGEPLEIANDLLDKLINEYGKRLKDSGDPLFEQKVDELRQINQALDEELRSSPLDGSEGQLQLVSRTLAYAAIMKKDEEFRLECLCDRVVPECPQMDQGLTLIPLACVELSSYKAGSIAATEVCMMCCRKQANTPRSQRYYKGDLIGSILSGFKELCTEETLRPDNGPSARLRNWLKDAGPAPWDPPYKTPLWPIRPTYGAANYQIGGPFYGTPDADVLDTWQRGFNPPILDITDLPKDDAVQTLEAAGFEINEIINAKNVSRLAELADYAPLLNRRPGPGDEVVLLELDNKAVEFVVIRQAKAGFFSRFRQNEKLLDVNLGPAAPDWKKQLGEVVPEKDKTDEKTEPAAPGRKDRPGGKQADRPGIKELDILKDGPGADVVLEGGKTKGNLSAKDLELLNTNPSQPLAGKTTIPRNKTKPEPKKDPATAKKRTKATDVDSPVKKEPAPKQPAKKPAAKTPRKKATGGKASTTRKTRGGTTRKPNPPKK